MVSSSSLILAIPTVGVNCSLSIIAHSNSWILFLSVLLLFSCKSCSRVMDISSSS
jgi:hypothetical protein